MRPVSRFVGYSYRFERETSHTVREFVHPECHMDRQCPAILEICDIVQFLKDLSIEETYQEAVGLVVVRDDAEQGRFPIRVLIDSFADCPDVDIIMVQNLQNLRVLKIGKPRMGGNDDGPDRVLGTAPYFQVCHPGRMVIGKHFHHLVQLRQVSCFLRYPRFVQQIHHLANGRRLPMLRAFIPDVGHDCLQIQGKGGVPEGVPAFRVFGSGIIHHVGDQLDDVIVRADIGEGIITVRVVHIDKIEGNDTVTFHLKTVGKCSPEFGFRRVFVKTKIENRPMSCSALHFV